MKNWAALKSGMIGACSLNVLHETGRKVIPIAPHIDLIAMRALGKSLNRIGVTPSLKNLRRIALAGDLLSNSIYYSAVGGLTASQKPRSVWKRAVLLGLAAGVGAVVLPPRFGIEHHPSRVSPHTGVLTIAWYLVGAFVTAGFYNQKKRFSGS
jgi:hypothetical protein